MPTAFLTRQVRFSAAHRYFRPEWTEARNREVFGPCSFPHGHGHNYLLEVTVQGDVDATTGFAVDLGALDELLAREVTAALDHRHLNHHVPEFGEGGATPTSENLLIWLWPRLTGDMPDGTRLLRLRLHEDESFYVDFYGGEAPLPSAPLPGA